MKKLLGVCSLALGMIVSGCSGGGAGSTEESAAQTQEALGYYGYDGYYQVSGGPQVYWVHGSHFCWARDPGELGALEHVSSPNWDGFSRPTFAMLQSGYYAAAYGIQVPPKVYDGTCHYPAGMYRRNGDAPVYSIGYSGNCHVLNNDQVNSRGGWGEVLVLNVKPGEMEVYENNPLIAYAPGCTY